MISCLAEVAKQARIEAGRRPVHIAAVLDQDPSTVYRFERGVTWPRDPERMIVAYGIATERDPKQLWREALRIWDDGSSL